MKASLEKQRFEYLDSVRGISALLVLLHHIFISIPNELRDLVPAWVSYTPLRVILIGRPAVLIFFILSGFVLTASILHCQVDLPRYIIRRLMRIYLPFTASILLSAIFFLGMLDSPTDFASGWLSMVWADGVSVDVIVDHLSMLGRPQDLTLNPVVWSLWYEIRISVLIPLIVSGLLCAGRTVALVAIVAVWLGCEILTRQLGLEPNAITATTLFTALLVTLHFVPMFAAGALLYIQRDAAAALYARLGTATKIALWLLTMSLLTRFSDLLTFPAAFFILFTCIASPSVQRNLKAGALQWLGQISFSLYLTHVPLIAAVYSFSFFGEDAFVRSLLAFVLSLVLADVFYRLVEAPSIRLSQRLKTRASGFTATPT